MTVFNMYETAGERCFDSSPAFDAHGTLCGTTRVVHVTDYATQCASSPARTRSWRDRPPELCRQWLVDRTGATE